MAGLLVQPIGVALRSRFAVTRVQRKRYFLPTFPGLPSQMRIGLFEKEKSDGEWTRAQRNLA